MKYDSLIERLAVYTIEPLEPTPEALHTAHLCLADALGCAIAALQFPACTKLLGPLVPGTMVPNGCRLPGRSDILDPVRGAFNLGSMIRWLDYNDTWLAREWAHPSDNIGGLLTLADFIDRRQFAKGATRLSMYQLLIAIIKAYEIQGVLALSNSFNSIGLDHVILVKVASAAAASYLLGANYEQAAAAISNAWLDLCALRTYRHAPNVGSRKSWAAGDATSRGVQLALMAMQGEMGYRAALSAPIWGLEDVLFKGQPLTLERDLACYVIENILFKVSFPAEFHAQTAVEAAIKLRQKLGTLHIDDIKAIDIETQAAALRIIDKKGPLHNPADRDHCLQYMVAVAFLYGDLTAKHYENEIAKNLHIDLLRSKMSVTENLAYSQDYLDPNKRSISNKIAIELNNKTQKQCLEIEYPLGHKRRRLEAIPRLWEKLQTNLSTHFSPKQTTDIIQLWQNQQKIEAMPVANFMTYFLRPDLVV